jgi:hypothetical protein
MNPQRHLVVTPWHCLARRCVTHEKLERFKLLDKVLVRLHEQGSLGGTSLPRGLNAPVV